MNERRRQDRRVAALHSEYCRRYVERRKETAATQELRSTTADPVSDSPTPASAAAPGHTDFPDTNSTVPAPVWVVDKLAVAVSHLIELKAIKRRIEDGTATDEEKRCYDERKEWAWNEAHIAIDDYISRTALAATEERK